MDKTTLTKHSSKVSKNILINDYETVQRRSIASSIYDATTNQKQTILGRQKRKKPIIFRLKRTVGYRSGARICKCPYAFPEVDSMVIPFSLEKRNAQGDRAHKAITSASRGAKMVGQNFTEQKNYMKTTSANVERKIPEAISFEKCTELRNPYHKLTITYDELQVRLFLIAEM
ncbi:hypothetical protein TNCV_4456981 [Trichonephila clavipes]|nr:hypothetical protein TNCV_4456981 [Trichonephila clavipes]